MSSVERRLINLDDLSSNIISVTIPILIPDSIKSGLAADSTGVKYTSSFKFKWNKKNMKSVNIRATWSSSATDNTVKICVKDDNTGNDIVCVSGNAGTDEESTTSDLSNITDGGTATVYAEVTTASATSGATFDISYIVVEITVGAK